MFRLTSPYQPIEPQAIAAQKLVQGLKNNQNKQVLLGVTGSGKTFVLANVIQKTQLPTLVISHNKTLANQLFNEFTDFFPENAVHYFISYYDYYQPEAYLARTDTYIQKDADINREIEQLRYATTADLMTRDDVIVVASVSCIYGISDPRQYENIALKISVDQKISRKNLINRLIDLQYKKNDLAPEPGQFSTRGEYLEIFLPQGKHKIRVEADSSKILKILRIPTEINSGDKKTSLSAFKIFPAKHYVTPENQLKLAVENIKLELDEQLKKLKKEKKLLEAQRLEQRTKEDLAMMKEVGYCSGIENYSRHLEFRKAGESPFTLIDYFNHRFGKNGWLLAVDESHISLPQVRGMHAGDFSRKTTLVDYGFRLPSAIDNRPLKFSEFLQKTQKTIYMSATPAEWEKNESGQENIIEQIIRPTGIVEPKIEIKPAETQVEDLIKEIKANIKKGEKTLALVLTKRMSENLTEYLLEQEIKTHWLHSEIKALDRPELLNDLRLGNVDVVVGINLLREGLDLPEVSLIAILDADKEGFLRNETALLQIIGRAARHLDGRVILYADKITRSIKNVIEETDRKRKIQIAYNQEHQITPRSIEKAIKIAKIDKNKDSGYIVKDGSNTQDLAKIISSLEKEMKKAAKLWDFERAAHIKEQIQKLLSQEKNQNN